MRVFYLAESRDIYAIFKCKNYVKAFPGSGPPA